MNKGFIPLIAVIIAGITSIVAGGGGYVFYKFSELKEENEKISNENEKIRAAFDSNLASEVPTTTSEGVVVEAESPYAEEEDVVTKQDSLDTTSLIDVAQTVAPVSNSYVNENASFVLRCQLASDRASVGSYTTGRVTIYEGNVFGQGKNYDISWSSKDLSEQGDKDGKFMFSKEGDYDVFVTATSKLNQQKVTEKCGNVRVTCNDYECLSRDEQKRVEKISILEKIADLIDGWYDGSYQFVSAAQQCSIAESIVRAHLYEYTSVGGENAPEFSEEVDCANDVAPKAYKYKIELLQNSI